MATSERRKAAKKVRPHLVALQKASSAKAASLIMRARENGFVPKVAGEVRRMKI